MAIVVTTAKQSLLSFTSPNTPTAQNALLSGTLLDGSAHE